MQISYFLGNILNKAINFIKLVMGNILYDHVYIYKTNNKGTVSHIKFKIHRLAKLKHNWRLEKNIKTQ